MTTFSRCCSSFVTLSRAAAKAGAAKLRRFGVAPIAADWTRRAAICERCPLRAVIGGVSYCGTPLLNQLDRNPVYDGCGCPCRDKAKSPSEHCPLDRHHRASQQFDGQCTCKWCVPVQPVHNN